MTLKNLELVEVPIVYTYRRAGMK